ncbi:HEAT repeat domain-containing protein [Mariniblastus sp.]|nr:HEAT repeat domain-containing protein [Mariniblastus sp.]MDA7932915.1 HEAT repeat domain-containing protein [Mariniblastus sp.]
MATGVEELDQALERLANARDRDEHHKLLGELAPIAAQHVETIALKFDDESFPKFNTIWALIGQSDDNVIELFCRALNDSDKYVRWAASEALAKCTNKMATDALVSALKDRSTLVKGVAVSAMKHLKPKTAVPQLKKIVQSKHLMKNSPGIVDDANSALALIENVG